MSDANSKDVARRIILEDIKHLNMKIDQTRAEINVLYAKETELQAEVFRLIDLLPSLHS